MYLSDFDRHLLTAINTIQEMKDTGKSADEIDRYAKKVYNEILTKFKMNHLSKFHKENVI